VANIHIALHRSLPLKVLLAIHHRFELWNAPEWLGPRLQQEFPEHQFIQLTNLDNLTNEIVDSEVFVGWQLRPEQFKEADKLRWIHATTAAVHQLMFPELVASDIRVTNSTEIHGPVVAEHAIALVLALAKGLPWARKYQHQHHWGQQDLWRSFARPREIAGATLGVIGLGAIGRECVRLAKALGMRVIALREHPERGPDGADRVLGPAELNELLARSDYVLLAAPLTPRTQALFDNRADEKALLRALRDRNLRAAALDVFQTEPLPGDSPLWDLENLFITPHTAALTGKLWVRHFDRISENFRRYLAGKPLLGEVDKQKGY
jgi:phosphoglycerate dehydrogenase-like enzyme